LDAKQAGHDEKEKLSTEEGHEDSKGQLPLQNCYTTAIVKQARRG
jgi:hypothetical protein